MSKLSQRAPEAASWIVAEATYGTDPGSPTQIYPIAGSVEVNPDQDELENDEQRTDLYDGQTTVHGLRKGSLKFATYLRADATQLAASTVISAQPWLTQCLDLAFGATAPAISTLNASMTLGAATDADGVTITDSTDLTDGQWVLAKVSSSYEPARLINKASTTTTVQPSFSTTPTTGAGSLLAMWQHAPARAFTKSFSFRHAINGDAGLQWLARGCKMDSLEIDLSLGQLPKATFGASIGTWGHATSPLTAPGALGYTAAAGTQGMSAPFVVKDAVFVLQSTALTARSHYSLESASLKLDLGTFFIPDLGGVEGKAGVMRVSGRNFAEWTVRARPEFVANADTIDASYWTGQTALQASIMIPRGTGTAKQWLVFDLPTCRVVGKPKYVSDGGRLLTEFVLRSQRSTVVTGTPTEGNDWNYAPFVMAYG